MNTTALEERIQKLEDIEAIKNLMARYAFHTNKGWNGKVVDVEAMPSIYAEDASGEIVGMQRKYQGLKHIMETLKEETAVHDFSMHSFTNPIIAVDGDHATGNWLLWIAVKNKEVKRQVFASEDITYVRTTQGWRIQTITMHAGMAIDS